MNLGVSVDLRGGGDEHPGLDPLGQPEDVDGADGVGLDRLHRVEHVVGRAGGRGQVVDLVHLQEERVDDVVVNHLEVFVPDPVLYVPLPVKVRIST